MAFALSTSKIAIDHKATKTSKLSLLLRSVSTSFKFKIKDCANSKTLLITDFLGVSQFKPNQVLTALVTLLKRVRSFSKTILIMYFKAPRPASSKDSRIVCLNPS